MTFFVKHQIKMTSARVHEDFFQHYYNVIKKFNNETLTIPSKTETITTIKHALNHCDKSELYLIADMLDIPHRTSESRMKLNILDKTQQIIYGHVITGWNTVARWGFLLVLYFLFAKITEGTKASPSGLLSTIHNGTNILIAILSLFGTFLATKFLLKFKHSWDIRRLIQTRMTDLNLIKRESSTHKPRRSTK
jgi:hypothetical protein